MAVRELIERGLPALTAGQGKIAHAVLADYPFAGLHPIQELASRTGVSPPTVSRFVARMGFAGYQDFQRALIAELREGSRSPVAIRATTDVVLGEAFLSQYADRFAGLARQMGDAIAHEQVAAVAELCGDPLRRVFVRGGQVSDCLARYLSLHLQRIRPGVWHMPDDPQQWPHTLLRMRRKDVVVLFDLRRYQPSLERLAHAVHAERRANVVLVTDTWQSPIACHSSRVVALPIDIGTAWDSSAAPLAFVEALVVLVTERDWPKARRRMESWDAVRRDLDRTNGQGDDDGA
jgi:DNA-binding MurR/RpiR family transcriptional regulator